MAGYPVHSGPPNGLDNLSDHEEPMDTDSEADNGPREDISVNGDHDPEDDLSSRMEISDTEDPIREKTGKNSLPPRPNGFTNNGIPSKGSGNHRPANGFTNQVPLQKEIDRIIQDNTSITHVDRNRIVPLDDIQDLKQAVHILSIPLWQKILSFLPPTSLGKVLRTSRLFHALLNPQGLEEIALQDRFYGKLGFKSSEAIWQISRTRYAPGLPRPLKNKSELEMWQLILGQTCQMCRQTKPFMNAQDIANPWSSGPGDNGVRIVWLCAVRICGICLVRQSQQVWSL